MADELGPAYHGADGPLRMHSLDAYAADMRRMYIRLQATATAVHGAPDDLPTPQALDRREYTHASASIIDDLNRDSAAFLCRRVFACAMYTHMQMLPTLSESHFDTQNIHDI